VHAIKEIGQVLRVFLLQGLIVGALGSTLGVLLAVDVPHSQPTVPTAAAPPVSRPLGRTTGA